MSDVLNGFLWLIEKGYGAAFLLGWVAAMCVPIARNARQIRRNSETIRRALEAKINRQ